MARNDIIYIKQRVRNESVESLREDGFDVASNYDLQEDYMSKLNKSGIMKHLTRKQQKIVICLIRGLSREETALTCMVSRQSINQIVPRIRERLKRLGLVYDRPRRLGGNKKPRMAISL